MPFPIIQFLYERGPRPAATRAEATALQYIENQFQATGLETSNVVFPSFGGAEWYYALSYMFFPLATVLYLDNVWLAFTLVTLGMALLRLDFFIWPLLNRLLALISRSRTVTGRVQSAREPRQMVIVSANADSRRLLPWLAKRPMMDRVLSWLMRIIDLFRVLHWLFYLAALLFTLFSMRDQVQLMWRLSWIPALLCMATVACYLAQAMHGRPVSCANDNLSGLQTLVDLATSFAQDPCERTELIFAATGSGRAGMLGMHFLLQALRPSRERTLCLHLSALGGGKVAMVGSEGWTRPIYASDALTDLGYLIGSTTPLPLEVVSIRQRRGDAAVARTLGYQALTLVGLSPDGVPLCGLSEEQLDAVNLEHSFDCVARMIRTIDRQA